MGTDIHYNLERWIPETKRWEVFYTSEMTRDSRAYNREDYEAHWGHPLYLDRNYVLFGVLAGVRNYGVIPIDDPRGFPLSNSGGTYASKAFSYSDVSGGGYHSASWLTIREIMDYEGFQTNCDLIQPMLGFTTIWLPEVLKHGKPEELRIVFCFDS